ncbi:ABC transporter ATP-binding protein [Luxibacter massiliensis]|uniref:ABC transporter ATP-binding protein n=1 Tax=Luxibacter massiliensis TaxID=2219695 RepID=UPI000F04A560|nr:ABC transporter ATP-binding protein [Luxibacter massiliensis]
MIEVKNLVKKYGNHTAIDHLNFKIEKGKVYGFLGPNGAGKSTTMNIMTGYLGATEGEVLINGHDILREPEEAKKYIGYLPELPPLYTEMTVIEYLRFAAELKGLPKKSRETDIDQALNLAKLKDVSGRLIRNLSKGYRQRVGLAQAVLGFPDIIILDEPTVGLDPKQIIEIRELIRKLAEEHTVILSSHILAEVREVCDYIMIISRGRLVASDTPDNLEHLMDGLETIEVEARADLAQVREVLKAVDGISSFKAEEKDEGIVSAEIEANDKEDVRERIFFAFAERKCPLITLKINRASLEEIFLELTQGDSSKGVSGIKNREDEKDGGNL